ncbi:helix-turn-helix domain-containing protein [Aminipila sp.]|uniref:helix-turn-helix domain-containing protein n=1 Tax=Aminipila sp. TaxID=2060095 RepID=UPI003FA42501
MTHKKNPSKIVFANTTIERINSMSQYTHFTTFERERILFLLGQCKSLSFIASKLNRNKSSISREIKRNSVSNGTYSPSIAQRKYLKRRKNCKRKQLLSNKAIHDKV